MPSIEVALCDAGPLIALFSEGQYAQDQCQEVLKTRRLRLVATLPVLAEAFYFVARPSEREALWNFMRGGVFHIAETLPDDLLRMRDLMRKYADLPMDFADASLVATGERLNVFRIFTLDRRHFAVYRSHQRRAFETFP